MNSEKKTTLDFDLIKYLVKCLLIGAAGGYIVPMAADKIGVSEPLAIGVAVIAWIAYVYSKVKTEQKEEVERINTALQEAYKAGAEAALKQKV